MSSLSDFFQAGNPSLFMVSALLYSFDGFPLKSRFVFLTKTPQKQKAPRTGGNSIFSALPG